MTYEDGLGEISKWSNYLRMLATVFNVRGSRIHVALLGSILVLVLTRIHNLDVDLLVVIRASDAGGQCCAE